MRRCPVRGHEGPRTAPLVTANPCLSCGFVRVPASPAVQELLGHANIAITLDTYSHVIPGMGNQAAQAMEDALS